MVQIPKSDDLGPLTADKAERILTSHPRSLQLVKRRIEGDNVFTVIFKCGCRFHYCFDREIETVEDYASPSTCKSYGKPKKMLEDLCFGENSHWQKKVKGAIRTMETKDARESYRKFIDSLPE